MTSEANLDTLTDGLRQVVESVFASMLGLEVSQGGGRWFPSGDRVTAAVHLSGDWNGAVLVECGQQEACRFASRFLSIPPPGSVDDVVRDVLGELANMIGGNLKCVLTHGIRLSMPSVVDGSWYSFRVCGGRAVQELAYQSCDGPFWITVLAMSSQHTA